MFILSFIEIFTGIIAVILLVIGIILGYCLIFTSIIHNKRIRILSLNNVDESLKKEKPSKLLDFISNDLFTYIKNNYPLFDKKYFKEEYKGNILFKPKQDKQTYDVLVTVKLSDYEADKNAYITNNHIHGNSLYNGKALLFSVIEAIESKIKNDQLEFGLHVLLIRDDKQFICDDDEFEKYDLVLEEMGGIIDPITSRLRSHYAFIGTINTANATVRFKTDKYGNGKARITEFVKEARSKVIKKTLNRVTKNVLKEVAKDMNFSNRFIYQNPQIFSIFVKNSLYETDFQFLRTNVTKMYVGEIVETNEEYYIDIEFNFNVDYDLSQALKVMGKELSKYSISYQIVKNVFVSKHTKRENENFKSIEKVIHETFKDVYVTPFVIDDEKCNLGYDKLGKNHLNFSPVYYSHNARIKYEDNIVYISKAAVVLAIEFYKRFIDEYNRRSKCFVESVAEK